MPAETISIDEAAERSGFTRSFLYSQARLGTLPFPVLIIGRRMRVPTRPFDTWLCSQNGDAA